MPRMPSSAGPGRARTRRVMLPDISPFYPANPANVPPELANPTGRYRFQAALVVGSLFLFVLVYVGLIVGFGGFSVWALVTLLDMEEFRGYGPGGAAWRITLLALGGVNGAFLAL